MQKSDNIPSIFISYAWNSESEAIAKSVEKEFQRRGVRIIRDKIDLKYKGRVKDYMGQIGRGKYVVLIISNKYLKSENCMFELLQIFKNQDFYERIFPVVLDEVKIAKAADRLDLLGYWENEAENLDQRIRKLKELTNIQGVTDDLNLYTEIRNNIARITNILKDINTLNTDQHISSNFKQLYELIEAKIEKDARIENDESKAKEISKPEQDESDGYKPSKGTKKAIIGFVVLIAIILIVQSISQASLLSSEHNDENNGESEITTEDTHLVLEEIDTTETINESTEEKSPLVSSIKYDVTLVVPSTLVKEDVLIDNKPAQVINRNLNTITVRLRKKNSSHHFEIKKGSQSCIADKMIEKDSMRFAMLCD